MFQLIQVTASAKPHNFIVIICFDILTFPRDWTYSKWQIKAVRSQKTENCFWILWWDLEMVDILKTSTKKVLSYVQKIGTLIALDFLKFLITHHQDS